MLPPQGSTRASGATQSLIGDYSNHGIDRTAPLRTPLQENVILQEAKNQRMMREMTPLLDTSQGDIEDRELPPMFEGTGFGGIKPRSAYTATPNTILGGGTPQIGAAAGAKGGISDSVSVSGTPSRWGFSSVAGGSSIAGTTPLLRDQLGLNSNTFDSMSDTASVISDSISSVSHRAREKQLRSILASQLKSLPEPEYTYDLALPELEPESDGIDSMHLKPEDAADVLARNEQAIAEEHRKELARRHAVIRRNLPRPVETLLKSKSGSIVAEPNGNIGSSSNSSEIFAALTKASSMINAEMVKLVASDAYQFPTGKSIERPIPQHLPDISDDDLQAARDLIADETSRVQFELIGGQLPVEVFNAVWDDIYKSQVFVPPDETHLGTFQAASKLNKQQVTTALLLYCMK